jgi:hypothetical protein
MQRLFCVSGRWSGIKLSSLGRRTSVKLSRVNTNS